MEPSPVHTLTTTGVLSESLRIIKANYTHFLTLSLFFLPLSFSLIITPILNYKFPSNHHQNTLLISYLLFILTVYTLALCAIAMITYSTYHAFFGEPVNFLTSLKSLTYSFVPIVSTAVVANFILLIILICFLTFVGGILMFTQNILGFVIDYNSVSFKWFSAIVLLTMLVIIIYFNVKWSLAFVIVVVESKWGLAPLMRSSDLIKGMRSVSLSVILYFGICSVIFVWIYSTSVYVFTHVSSLVVFTLVYLFFITISCFLRITAANTVLYVYCKALHGELEIDVSERFVSEYINLPSNDEKVVIA